MKGRVLRIKSGYNPNSSSVGTGLPPYLFSILGTGLVTVFFATVVAPAVRRLRKTAAETERVSADTTKHAGGEDGR